MNKVFLSGNLTRDPEVRYTQSGMAYAKMGIAVARPYTSKNSEGQTTTDFFNLTSWGKQAEFCGRYLKKGGRVLVEGRIQNDNYEDKNGVKHYGVSIMVDNIEFADSKRRAGDNTSSGENNGGETGSFDDGEDVDVPF
jgi:single-strand DNA-binding protein